MSIQYSCPCSNEPCYTPLGEKIATKSAAIIPTDVTTPTDHTVFIIGLLSFYAACTTILVIYLIFKVNSLAIDSVNKTTKPNSAKNIEYAAAAIVTNALESNSLRAPSPSLATYPDSSTYSPNLNVSFVSTYGPSESYC